MHQAIPYKPIKLSRTTGGTSHPTSATLHHLIPHTTSYNLIDTTRPDINYSTNTTANAALIKSMVLQNPVIVIGRRGCCMGHVVKRLLLTLGVNPAVHEVDDDDRAEETVSEELCSGGERLQFPAVFIGGRLFGGLERVMATHISGELTPILKQAGALWL